MTHIPGHVDTENNSFGVLRPVFQNNGKLTRSKHSILFTPPSIQDVVSGKPFVQEDSKLELKYLVAFQPYLIPWGNGWLVIASNLDHWPDHVAAEVEAKKLGVPVPLEDYNDDNGLSSIKNAGNTIRGRGTSKDAVFGRILENTWGYMRTTSFETIYLNGKNRNPKASTKSIKPDQVVKWIEDNTVDLSEIGFESIGQVLNYIDKPRSTRELV